VSRLVINPTNLRLALRSQLHDQVEVAAAHSIADEVAARAQTVAQAHYSNALQQVKDVLRATGPATIQASGGKAVRFSYVDGTHGRAVTGHWAALTKRYAQKAPKSRQFWRKTGRLYRAFRRAADGKGVSVLSTRVERKRGRTTLVIQLGFEAVGRPFTTYLTRSFVAGKEFRAAGILRGRTRLERVIYLEDSLAARTSRPMIAQMSAQLGRKMLTSLRKLK